MVVTIRTSHVNRGALRFKIRRSIGGRATTGNRRGAGEYACISLETTLLPRTHSSMLGATANVRFALYTADTRPNSKEHGKTDAS
jgi:hypothetical protein